MRLYLFLSIVAFFAMQSSIHVDDDDNGNSGIVQFEDDDEISQAKTVEEVNVLLAQAQREFATSRKAIGDGPGASAAKVGIDMAEKALLKRAEQQRSYLTQVAAAKAAGQPVPKRPATAEKHFDFPINGQPWDAKSNPVAFTWLPDAINGSINRRMARAKEVLESSHSEKPVVDALFRVSPQVLFVLMPLFALLLKLAYVFKRRLYMEHLIVALHSHSFISLALILVLGTAGLQNWLAPADGFLNGLLGWILGLTIAWIPLYLLLMQKRVYGQSWPMTLIKYAVLGLSYTLRLGLGLAVALLVGLMTL